MYRLKYAVTSQSHCVIVIPVRRGGVPLAFTGLAAGRLQRFRYYGRSAPDLHGYVTTAYSTQVSHDCRIILGLDPLQPWRQAVKLGVNHDLRRRMIRVPVSAEFLAPGCFSTVGIQAVRAFSLYVSICSSGGRSQAKIPKAILITSLILWNLSSKGTPRHSLKKFSCLVSLPIFSSVWRIAVFWTVR